MSENWTTTPTACEKLLKVIEKLDIRCKKLIKNHEKSSKNWPKIWKFNENWVDIDMTYENDRQETLKIA